MDEKKEYNEDECRGMPPLEPPESALILHDDILDILEDLVASPVTSALDPAFRGKFFEVLSLFDVYQQETVAANDKVISCKPGCSVCCCHWAEDIGSFEMAIIGDYIRKNMPERIEEIVNICRDDTETINKLDTIVKIKREEFSALGNPGDFDQTFMLLSAFYQLGRPCPLLDENGACSIYPVRPITCRIYMSFSDPALCAPDKINEGEVVTYVLDFLEEANVLLDRLHVKFLNGKKHTALRAALVEELG